jgi:predicted dehydrogenase
MSLHVPNNASRRRFLKTAATASTAALVVAPHVLGGTRHVAPSDMINVAVVGIGGRGLKNARELMRLDDVRITAVADPAEQWDLSNYYYGGSAGRLPGSAEIDRHYQQRSPNFKCRPYVDFREMLAAESDLDAVLCATPDHLHANVTLAALRAGKHAYCEKPLTHSIEEARLVSQVAAETGLATQMGNQGHSNEGIRKTVEWIRAGVIGQIEDVHAWVPATRWNKTLVAPPTESQSIPSGLDWDLWCGPREVVGFNDAYAPVSWRDFWQFGCGAMGDFGCHDMDSAVWALDLDQPIQIEMQTAGQTHPNMTPYGEIGFFDFPAKGTRGPVRIHWYSGGLEPRKPKQMPADQSLPSRGVLFEGSDGIMLCGGAGGEPTVYLNSGKTDFETPEPTLARSNGHHRDWIDAIKGGPPASSNFQVGAHLTETTLLGLVALRAEQIIRWDAASMNVTNVDVQHFVRNSYRSGWNIHSA